MPVRMLLTIHLRPDPVARNEGPDAPWYDLRNAIIEQAVKDYRKYFKHRQRNKKELKQLDDFFLNGPCDFYLCRSEGITGKMILERLQTEEKMWRRARGIIGKGDDWNEIDNEFRGLLEDMRRVREDSRKA